jgi:hypothetical protein
VIGPECEDAEKQQVQRALQQIGLGHDTLLSTNERRVHPDLSEVKR